MITDAEIAVFLRITLLNSFEAKFAIVMSVFPLSPKLEETFS